MDRWELIVHPVRLRLINALSGGRELTIAQLGEAVPDVSQATVYRQVGALAEGGLIEVSSERRARGAIERTYRLNTEHSTISETDAAAAGPEEHRRVFAIAMSTLLAEFTAYLDRDDADPRGDLVGYRQSAIWLTPDELRELIERMRAAIVPTLANAPEKGRRRYVLSPILFPSAESPTD